MAEIFLWLGVFIIMTMLVVIAYLSSEKQKLEEKIEVLEREKQYIIDRKTIKPTELLEAQDKLILLRRENEDLKEEIEKLTFEKEELQKKLAQRPHHTVTLCENSFDLFKE